MKKPDMDTQPTQLGDLQQGCQYVMIASLEPGQQGMLFYRLHSPVDNEQYANFQRGAGALGTDMFVVDCIFNEATTVQLSNTRAVRDDERVITFELLSNGHARAMDTRNLQ